jgi:hypothetical protein
MLFLTGLGLTEIVLDEFGIWLKFQKLSNKLKYIVSIDEITVTIISKLLSGIPNFIVDLKINRTVSHIQNYYPPNSNIVQNPYRK